MERSSPKDQKAKLVSYTEDLRRPQSDDARPRAPAKRERKLEHGDVQSLHVVPTPEAGERLSPVLVAHQSGNIECISGDLAGMRWEHKSDDNFVVECSVLTDLDSVRRGLLRGREDILALLESANTEAGANVHPAILCQVVRLEDRRQIRVYALRNVDNSDLQSQRSPLEEVMKCDLPGKFVTGHLQFELSAAAGTLYQQGKERLTLYDLSGTLPRIAFQLGRYGQRHVDSYARLSGSAVITSCRQHLAVYDTKYGSILGSMELSQSGSTAATETSLRFVTAYSELGIVVALSGHTLVALQVGGSQEDGRRSRAAGPLLLDVVGKGKYTADQADVAEVSEKRRRKWETWVSKVDRFLQHQDLEGIEKLVAKDLNFERDGQDGSTLTNGLANGHTHEPCQPWSLLPRHYDPQHLNRKKALYILGQIFAWRSESTGLVLGQRHLQLKLPSPNILAWLSLAGLLTAQEVEHALPRTATDFPSQPRVIPGDIAYAIGEADPAFDLLCNLLSLPAFWELSEIVQGVKVLINSFEEQDESKPRYLLTNGDLSMADGNDADKSEVQFEAEEAAAMRDIERANDLMEAGISQRSTAFRKCLVRLQEFNQREVSRALRSQMSQDEIIFLIQIMRVELANGGWTFTYAGYDDSGKEVDPTAQALSLDNQGIRNIAQLISCAVDAIGFSGWTVGLSGNRFVIDDLLHSLINETSAVMEGLFAAENLETTLKEMERTAESIQRQSLKRKIDFVEEQPEFASELTVMPLGGRSDAPQIGKAVNKAFTAEQKRRSVGKYSFERIRI